MMEKNKNVIDMTDMIGSILKAFYPFVHFNMLLVYHSRVGYMYVRILVYYIA